MDEGFVTYYKGEDNLHPRLAAAFEWWESLLQPVTPMYRGEVALAGGALRSFFTDTPTRDYDIYGTAPAVKAVSRHDFFALSPPTLVSQTNNSYVYRRLEHNVDEQRIVDQTFNIIKKPFSTIENIIDSFDFTVCMCAITQEAIAYHPDYFTDLATKRIRIHNPNDPLSTLWRVQKYIKYGYTIDREELWKVASELNEIESFPVLVESDEEKTRRSLKENPKTLEEIFRSS